MDTTGFTQKAHSRKAVCYGHHWVHTEGSQQEGCVLWTPLGSHRKVVCYGHHWVHTEGSQQEVCVLWTPLGSHRRLTAGRLCAMDTTGFTQKTHSRKVVCYGHHWVLYISTVKIGHDSSK